jgi:hydrogenase small subunit
MKVTRREFLRTAAGMAGILGLNATGLLKLQDALAIYYTTIDDLLINKLNLEYHPNVMAAAGSLAMSAMGPNRPTTAQLKQMSKEWLITEPGLASDLDGNGTVNFIDYALMAKKGFILIVEGAIPTGANGAFCEIGENLTMIDAMRKYGSAASHIIAVGSCAAFGGIPAAAPNPTGALSVQGALTHLGIQKSVVNIPGCPIHPDWLVGTVIDLLTGQAISLDSHKRPLKFFPAKVIHERCPFRGGFEAHSLGVGGCLQELGCKGAKTHADCDIRRWNNPAKGQTGVNWCIGAGSPCIGCTEPSFPDGDFAPFYHLGGEVDDD